MKKNKIFIVSLISFIVFFISINNVKALNVCDFENNYGSFNSVAIKNISTCGIKNREKGCDMYGLNSAAVLNYNMTSRGADSVLWSDDEVKFSYAFAADYGKDGDYVKTAKATLYDDNGNAQCYIEFDKDKLEKEKYELVGWQFVFNKKHVSYIEFSGTYYSNTSDDTETYNGSNGYEKVDIRKKTDGSGIEHTGDGSGTTTSMEEITEGGAASGTAKGSAKPMLQTDKNGNVINSYDKKQACTSVRDIVRDYWKYVLVIAPVLLIVVITLDFFKALSSNDADAIKKAGTNTVKRTIAAVILLGLPALLDIVFNIFGLDLCV